MKKTLILLLLVVCIATGCTKEAAQKETSVNNTSSTEAVGADAVIKALGPGDILGKYAGKGSRTVYYGQANDNADNIKLILDFFTSKNLTIAPDKQHLLLPYGYGNYIDRGWKYVIGYNFIKKKITVEANDAMKEDIVPGSFEVLYADYSLRYKSWVFQTRFTAKEDNGNESEVVEPLSKVNE